MAKLVFCHLPPAPTYNKANAGTASLYYTYCLYNEKYACPERKRRKESTSCVVLVAQMSRSDGGSWMNARLFSHSVLIGGPAISHPHNLLQKCLLAGKGPL